MKAYGRVAVWIHVSLTSALFGGKRSASCPGRFTSGEMAPGTYWIGVWVGPRTKITISWAVTRSGRYRRFGGPRSFHLLKMWCRLIRNGGTFLANCMDFISHVTILIITVVRTQILIKGTHSRKLIKSLMICILFFSFYVSMVTAI
jgi:hypothetical protein